MQLINIFEIKSNKTRNILRGIIGETDTHKVRKSFEKIRRVSSRYDYKKSFEVIKGNSLFERNPVSRDFNKVCPKGLDNTIRFSKGEIIESINNNSTRLLQILILYKELMQALSAVNYDQALEVIENIIDSYGVSCFLVRILFYMRNHVDDSEEHGVVLENIDVILDKIEVGNVRYLESAIRELSNPRTDYFNICNKIKDLEGNDFTVYIANNFITHVVKNESQFIDTLSAYYEFSLIDAFLYFSVFQRLELPFTGGIECINIDLLQLFQDIEKVDVNIDLYNNVEDESSGLSFYRECFLILENKESFNYKTMHGAIFNKNEQKEQGRLPIEKRLLNEYFSEVRSLDDIRNTEASAYRINFEKYCMSSCNQFENSNALLFCIEQKDADIDGKEKEFVGLMTHTGEIGLICQKHYIQKIKENAITDELKLVIACLMSIKDKRQIVEHELRSVIQDITVRKFESNITMLISDLYEISPSVTEHLIQICDETFLSKLFHITNKPNKAIEDRADILEWYGKKSGDIAYVKRAKNLRIDVQISRAKGTIDDSRIYVDPLKFTQWINDNILNDLTLLLEELGNISEIKAVNIEWGKVGSGILHNERIASLLLRCYEEFCNNKLFGIASYLGRRIRHGTFKGTGLREVKDFESDSRYQKLFSKQEFLNCFSKWMESYDSMLEELKSSNLYVKSKKQPKGMISCEFDTSSKKLVANRMYLDTCNSFINNEYSQELPYIITDYCWRIIEEDLSNIRKSLMEKKAKYAVFKFDHNSLAYGKRKCAQDFCQELNSATADKFRTISSWFNKPSIASPSTDLVLLFKAVLSEINGFFTNYSPDIKVNEREFQINGGLYFVIYDALYILIYNAAKYGVETGLLEFNTELPSDEKVIKISIASEVINNGKLLEAKKLIDKSLVADFEDAHVIEGRSGIKKLRLLEKDKYIKDVNYSYHEKYITASFKFDLGY